ncbi:hypothetical protein QJS10_CPA06g01149 [Acorus calamus]|uniref:Reverse transcriptase zinc-binding domain-containing protein n=1 Tax=Acorus calamus TaxID=4465 RepID=A0AAV9EI31_ACOCL|nr:hypothetical protein QJS10_CPA06g01149 [Acorus calamus]
MWNSPWLVVGDFNVTRFPEDRNRPGQITPGMAGFSSWIDGEGLIDIPTRNQAFTWSNLREIPSLARLDRILLDAEWEAQFPRCEVVALPRVVSDHVPLLLTGGGESYTPSRFCYEAWWSSIEGFNEVVRGARSKCAKMAVTRGAGLIVMQRHFQQLRGICTDSALGDRSKWREGDTIQCALCGLVPETVAHLFCECHWAQELWHMVGDATSLARFHDLAGMWAADAALGAQLEAGNQRRVAHLIVPACTWTIWLTRNDVIFKGARVYTENMWAMAAMLVWEWACGLAGTRGAILGGGDIRLIR